LLNRNPFALKEEAVKFACLIFVSLTVVIPAWADCAAELAQNVRDQLQESELSKEVGADLAALRATVRQIKAGNTSSHALLVEKVSNVIPLAASVPASTQNILNHVLEKLHQDADDLAYQNEQLAGYKTQTQDSAVLEDIETLVARNETQIRRIQSLLKNKSNPEAIAAALEG